MSFRPNWTSPSSVKQRVVPSVFTRRSPFRTESFMPSAPHRSWRTLGHTDTFSSGVGGGGVGGSGGDGGGGEGGNEGGAGEMQILKPPCCCAASEVQLTCDLTSRFASDCIVSPQYLANVRVWGSVASEKGQGQGSVKRVRFRTSTSRHQWLGSRTRIHVGTPAPHRRGRCSALLGGRR